MKLFSQLLDTHLLVTIFSSDLVLYRGIGYSHKPTSYQDLIYPPVDKAKLNRASDKGEQLFYAATKKKAVFYELNAKPNDCLAISTWVPAMPLLISNIGYTSENLKYLGAEDSTPFFDTEDNKINAYIKNKVEHEIISDYISKTFSQNTNDENIYKITIAIAQILMGEIVSKKGPGFPNEFDGLLYPTIKYNAKADNIVLKKHVIDFNKLSFERVEFIKIVDYSDNKYQYKILDVAESLTDNIIEWKNLSKTWKVNDESDDLYFVDGKAFNEYGNEIYPES